MSWYSKNGWPGFHEPLDLSRDPKEPPAPDADWAGFEEWYDAREQRGSQGAGSEQAMLELPDREKEKHETQR